MTSSLLRLLLASLICFILTIMPLPDLLGHFRPSWILLLVLYLQFFLPQYFSITLIFIVGLTLDVLLSSVLGEHVFALSLVCLIANTKARRFKLFSTSQQIPLIGLFCFFYQIIILTINTAFGYQTNMLMLLANILITALLWPWIKMLMEDILFKRKVCR